MDALSNNDIHEHPKEAEQVLETLLESIVTDPNIKRLLGLITESEQRPVFTVSVALRNPKRDRSILQTFIFVDDSAEDARGHGERVVLSTKQARDERWEVVNTLVDSLDDRVLLPILLHRIKCHLADQK